jgi:hypothetical protein
MFRHGLRTTRLILDGAHGAVETPFHLTPQAEPSGTASEGDVYFSTSGYLMQYTGSAWEQVGASQAGVITPSTLYWAFRVGPHASVTEYDLAVIPRALQVTSISVVPSTLQGGALTATLVKAINTATPVKTTTPLHTADAIDLNTGAYTVQTITLTATANDLIFAAGNRLSIDYSAALTAGHAAITVGFKYV